MNQVTSSEAVMADGFAFCKDGTTVDKAAHAKMDVVERIKMFGWGDPDNSKVAFSAAKFCANGPRSGQFNSFFAGMQVPWFEGQEMMPHEQQKAEKAAKKAMKAAKKAAENK